MLASQAAVRKRPAKSLESCTTQLRQQHLNNCGAHLEQGKCKDGVVVAAQVRRQLVGPGQAQQQVGGHEVVVERPLEEQLAAEHRLGHAAPPLACRTFALSTVFLLKGNLAVLCPAC